MNIQENVSLRELTTLRAGGRARFLVEIEDEQDLESAFAFARKRELRVFILGGGSNTFFSDEGFDGLVIKINIRGKEYRKTNGAVFLKAGAGETWDALAAEIAEKELWGTENLAFIPGTLGAAPVQNIGAYGTEISALIEEVRVFDRSKQQFYTMHPKDCAFGYRTSIFKQTDTYVITYVTLRLGTHGEPNITYKGLADLVEERGIKKDALTPQVIRDMVIEIRTRKLPQWDTLPTAGSFFKNPEISSNAFNDIVKIYPDLQAHETQSGTWKISLAWVIEHICKMKGECRGDACVYENHALVLINRGNASARDINDLADDIADCVYAKTGIRIEREVRFIF